MKHFRESVAFIPLPFKKETKMLKPLFSANNPFWTAVEKETVDLKKTPVEEVAKVVQPSTEETSSTTPKVEVVDSVTPTEPPVAKDNSNVTDVEFKEVPKEETPKAPSKANKDSEKASNRTKVPAVAEVVVEAKVG